MLLLLTLIKLFLESLNDSISRKPFIRNMIVINQKHKKYT